jgi:hypothetical protein
MGDTTSSYATAGTALRVSGALKTHHHDKAETASVGICMLMFTKEENQRAHSQYQENAVPSVNWYFLTEVFLLTEYRLYEY